MGPRSSDTPSVRVVLLSAAIFIVALFVRIVPMGLYVTPDEPIWVMRSVAFLEAVQAGDLTTIPQTGHPGITTMALGALGVRAMALLAPGAAAEHLDWIGRMAWLAPENADAFGHLAYFLPAGRLAVAVVTSAGLVCAYWLASQRFDSRTARWLALFLALDPFVAGHSGLLHTDALQATFALLAVLFAMPRMSPGDRQRVRGSGVRQCVSLALAALCLALAGLTKTLGLLVAPGVAIAWLLWGRGSGWQRFVRVAALAALTLLFLVVLYPPFWAAPRAAVESLVGAVAYHESIGQRPVYFLGEMRTDPGPVFYPLVMLYRLTLPACLGIVAALFGGAGRRPATRRLLRWGGLTALIYVAALTVPAKKFDRYMLTALVLLAPAAASAWSRASSVCKRIALPLLLFPWSMVAVAPLHYASPLLGGPWIADKAIALGWGEASGLAARKLERRLPAPETMSVLTKNVSGTAAFFSGGTWPWIASLVGCADAAIGGNLDAPAGYVPVDRVSLAGRELATIYSLAPVAAPSLPLVAPGPLPGLAALAAPDLATIDELVDWLRDRLEPGDRFLWVRASACYPLTSAQLEAIFTAAEEMGQLVCQPGSPVRGFEAEVCQLRVPLQVSTPFQARFAGALDLVSVAWDESVRAPESLAVNLRWLPRADLGELDVYLAFVSGDGAGEVTWAEGGQRLINNWGWAAPGWRIGTVTDGKAYVGVPPDLPPGTYTLILSLSGDDGWLGAVHADGTFGGVQMDLGHVAVASASYPASQLEGMVARDADWPGLHVVGVDLPEGDLSAGRAMRFALGLERVEGQVADALAWEVVCDRERVQVGFLPWAATVPQSWTTGYRYRLQFAPRLAPNLQEGDCLLSVWPVVDGSGGPPSGSIAEDAVIVGEVSIRQRSRTFELPRDPEIPLAVTVETYGELVGADLLTSTLSSGGELAVTLYWHALAPAADDYTVFVHLVDSDNRVVAQSDVWPDEGRAPTTTWLGGEIVTDRHVLTVPGGLPAGEYGIYVGMYDAKRGSRQSLYSEGSQVDGDRAYLASVTQRH